MADMRSIINVISNFEEIIETMKIRGSGNRDEIANLEMNTNLLKAWAGMDNKTSASGLHLQRVRHSTSNVVNETLKQTQLDQDIKTRTKVFGMFESGDDINVSLIQRKCSVGYFSATRVLENLIEDGFVEPQNNGKGLNKFL